MDNNVGALLQELLTELSPLLSRFEKYLNSLDPDVLEEVSNGLISIGSSFYPSFTAIRHGVLSAVIYEAGMRLKYRAFELRTRKLVEGDLEYFKDIYELLRRIANDINSGEYEKGLRRMHERRKNG